MKILSSLFKRDTSKLPKPLLSIIVIVYDMPEQALETVYSLSSQYQNKVNDNEYEILVVENKSGNNINPGKLKGLGKNIHYVLRDEKSPTPVFAINEAAGRAQGDFLAIVIDGARLVTPGIVRATLDICRLDENATISVPGYHLGAEPQQQAILNGYSQSKEKDLLHSINWPEDGYRLFDIACLGGSTVTHGILQRFSESNYLVLSKLRFQELGGYEERFNSHGGGYANLDLFRRACMQASSRLFVLVWEGTFHQYHGGATTGGDKSDRRELMQKLLKQYIDIRGEAHKPYEGDFEIFGLFNPYASQFIASSMDKIDQSRGSQ